MESAVYEGQPGANVPSLFDRKHCIAYMAAHRNRGLRGPDFQSRAQQAFYLAEDAAKARLPSTRWVYFGHEIYFGRWQRPIEDRDLMVAALRSTAPELLPIGLYGGWCNYLHSQVRPAASAEHGLLFYLNKPNAEGRHLTRMDRHVIRACAETLARWRTSTHDLMGLVSMVDSEGPWGVRQIVGLLSESGLDALVLRSTTADGRTVPATDEVYKALEW